MIEVVFKEFKLDNGSTIVWKLNGATDSAEADIPFVDSPPPPRAADTPTVDDTMVVHANPLYKLKKPRHEPKPWEIQNPKLVAKLEKLPELIEFTQNGIVIKNLSQFLLMHSMDLPQTKSVRNKFSLFNKKTKQNDPIPLLRSQSTEISGKVKLPPLRRSTTDSSLALQHAPTESAEQRRKGIYFNEIVKCADIWRKTVVYFTFDKAAKQHEAKETQGLKKPTQLERGFQAEQAKSMNSLKSLMVLVIQDIMDNILAPQFAQVDSAGHTANEIYEWFNKAIINVMEVNLNDFEEGRVNFLKFPEAELDKFINYFNYFLGPQTRLPGEQQPPDLIQQLKNKLSPNNLEVLNFRLQQLKKIKQLCIKKAYLDKEERKKLSELLDKHDNVSKRSIEEINPRLVGALERNYFSLSSLLKSCLKNDESLKKTDKSYYEQAIFELAKGIGMPSYVEKDIYLEEELFNKITEMIRLNPIPTQKKEYILPLIIALCKDALAKKPSTEQVSPEEIAMSPLKSSSM